MTPAEVGDVDAVLLSHDQHPDNLDHGGRKYVPRTACCLSTPDAARLLAGTVRGLTPWDSIDLGTVTVTAVPAQHGPDGCEAVTGQVTASCCTVPMSLASTSAETTHRSTWCTQSSTVSAAGSTSRCCLPAPPGPRSFDGALLTLSSAQAAQAARILGVAHVVPLHFEGWAHFTQGRNTLQAEFAHAGLAQRLHLLDVATTWRLP